MRPFSNVSSSLAGADIRLDSYFPEREFGGTPWESPEVYQKWDPSKHVQNWKTPMLVIRASRHQLSVCAFAFLTTFYCIDGSKDYRLTEGESLAAFNALQRQGVPSRLLVFPSENHVSRGRHPRQLLVLTAALCSSF